MAHFIRLIKAKRIKSKLLHYQAEKEIALEEDESEIELFKNGKWEKRCQKTLFYRNFKQIKSSQIVKNVVWKSFLGFMGGVILTYIFFLFFHIAVNLSLKTSTYLCGLTGVILCLGLAFSSKVRCYVLLLLPVFFSNQGRQALLAYALFLAFTGPARNTMQNMEILSKSMICGQEMTKRTSKQITDMVKAPCRSVREILQKLKRALTDVFDSVKSFVMKIKRIIVSILRVIKMADRWLNSIVTTCNRKVGTPFQRCMKTFDEAITDCKAKLGVIDFLCHVVHIVKALCYTVKWLDFICLFSEFVSEKVAGVVKKKLKDFGLRMKNLFNVSIEFSHTYEFETTASNSTKEVAKTILQRISKKVEKLQSIFSFCGFIFSLFLLIIFFKVYYYRYKFLSSDKYDNIYISKYIVELDTKRAQADRETVLPLEPKEKKKYAKPTAIRLLEDEKIRIGQSVFLLTFASFKIITFIFVDYFLFWTLMVIYEAGHCVLEEVEKSKVEIHVEGREILANFYRNLGVTFQIPENPNYRLNRLHCLPDPVQPDTRRYIQMGFLVVLCWILTVLEAYGLRLRSVVMSHYYPDRARERAVWLYNHILRTRSSFLRFARRQLRRKFRSSKPVEKVTFCQRLFANFPLLRVIFGKRNENNCLLCGAPETKTELLKRCKTHDCQGRYCLKCFASLGNVCTICQHPIEYGDVSDLSEEVDSSEEDLHKKYGSEHDSDASQGSEKFLTFEEMESRDKFIDVEAYKVTDYAKLSDLYNNKPALQRRLKDVLHKHIRSADEKRNRQSQAKLTEYKQIKSKLQSVLHNLREKKLKQKTGEKFALRKKFDGKLSSPEKFKENQPQETEKLLNNKSKITKSRVSFKLDEELKPDLKAIKNELKIKLENRKNKVLSLGNSKSTANSDSGESQTKEGNSGKSGKSQTDDSTKNNVLTYYFIEKEKDFELSFNGKPNPNVTYSFYKKT